ELRHKNWHELKPGVRDALGSQFAEQLMLPHAASVGHLVSAGLSSEGAQIISDTVTAYCDALPFTDAERRWLIGVIHEIDEEYDWAQLMTAVMQKRGEVILAGKRQLVDGHELVSRWWDWTRRAGEFAEQGTYSEVLRGALAHISDLSPETRNWRQYLESAALSPQPELEGSTRVFLRQSLAGQL